VMALLRAEGGQDKPLVCMVATKDGRPTEAEAMILPLPPGESLVVNVARCLDAGSMISRRMASSWRRPAVWAIITCEPGRAVRPVIALGLCRVTDEHKTTGGGQRAGSRTHGDPR